MTNSCSQPYFPAEVVYLAHILVNIDLYANLISYDTKSIKFELMLIAYIDLMHKHLSCQTTSTWPTKFDNLRYKNITFELMLIAMHYIDLMHKHLSWQTRSTWPTKFGCAIHDWFELMLIDMHYLHLMHEHLSWQTRSTWPTKFGCAIHDWQMIFERNLLSGLSENTLLPSDNKGRVRVKKLHGRLQK